MLKIWILIALIILLVVGACIFQSKTKRHLKTNPPVRANDIFRHVPGNLKSEIHYMDHLNGYEFEDYTAWLLHLNGFVGIKQTGKNHDCGLDVLAYRNHVAYGFQCKHYKKRKIRRQVIKHTADGAHFYGTQKAVVLTNTRFSHEAVSSHKFFHVQLWDRAALIQLIQNAIVHYQRTN